MNEGRESGNPARPPDQGSDAVADGTRPRSGRDRRRELADAGGREPAFLPLSPNTSPASADKVRPYGFRSFVGRRRGETAASPSSRGADRPPSETAPTNRVDPEEPDRQPRESADDDRRRREERARDDALAARLDRVRAEKALLETLARAREASRQAERDEQRRRAREDADARRRRRSEQAEGKARPSGATGDAYREALRVFDLPANYTAEELRRKYRQLSKRAHPDLGGSAARFHALHDAFELLSEKLK